jgi:SSS family solute:Na+ symporter
MSQSLWLIGLVVAVYMVLITVAGSVHSRFLKSAVDYFKAGNAVPWWAAGISMYMSNFTAYTFVGVASLVYLDGLGGLLLETGPALAFLLAATCFARRWHRLNLMSPPEYLEARFNSATRTAFAVAGISQTFIASGLRLYAMCKFAEGMTGVPLEPAILICGVVVITYTLLGGLWAVIVTDFVQFVVLLLAATCLLALSAWTIFHDVGFASFLARIPADYGSFPGANPAHAWGWLLVFWFSYLLDYNGDWGIIQRMCCTPTERDARKAAWLAMAFSIPHAFFLLGPCFIARVLFADEIGAPGDVAAAEGVYGKISALLLPPGLVGVVIAAMLSATMSTLSTAWSVRSASFVNDLYGRFLRPAARDREQIAAGRAAVLVQGAAAIAVALLVARSSVGLFALSQSLVGLLVIPVIAPLLLALFMPRTKRWAALAALGACVAFAGLNKWGYPLFGRAAPLPFEWEVPLAVGVALGVLLIAARWPQTDGERAQQAAFARRLARPRPAAALAANLPPPLALMGTFTLLIGGLVFALVAVPQTAAQRIVTLVAAAVLVAIGIAMRRAQRRLAPPVAATPAVPAESIS